MHAWQRFCPVLAMKIRDVLAMSSSHRVARHFIALIGVVFVVGCGDGGGDDPPQQGQSHSPTFSTISDATISLALNDIDGDGYLDLIVGNELGPVRLYLNDRSTLAFEGSVPLELTPEMVFTRVLTADFDCDDVPDLAIGQLGGPNEDRPILLRLNGLGAAPFFSLPIELQTPLEGAGDVHLAAGDLDGDGDTDLVSAHGYNEGGVWFAHYRVLLHLNSGAPPFFEPPSFRILASQPTRASDIRGVAIGDVDGDQRPDIVVARGDGEAVSPRGNLFIRNLGDGNFAESVPLFDDLPNVLDLELGDLDGDGDLDVALIKESTQSDPIREILIYLNLGDGRFAARYSIGQSGYGEFSCVELGDIDGDEMLDLIVGGPAAERIMFNQGTDRPFEGGQWLEFSDADSQTTSAALGDLNNDGALDLVIGNWRAPNQVFLNESLVSLTE